MPTSAQPFSASVLVVEDDTTLRRCIMELLEPPEHQLMATGSLEEALRLLCEDGLRPCVVLVDRRLPGLHGHRLAIELARRGYPTPFPALVLLTGMELPCPAGFSEAVLKPFTMDQLRDVVRRNCSCKQNAG